MGYLKPKIKFNAFSWGLSFDKFVKRLIEGYTLHLCSGRSPVGHIRLDLIIWKKNRPNFNKCNILGSADKIPFKDNSFDTVLIDPIYKSFEPPFLNEIARVLKNSGLLIYYYPTIPNKNCFQLIKIYTYKNRGLNYLRILSLFRCIKLS